MFATGASQSTRIRPQKGNRSHNIFVYTVPGNVTNRITAHLPVVGKVFFCICFEGISLEYMQQEYQWHRLVASCKNPRLSVVSRQARYQRHPSSRYIIENVPVVEKVFFCIHVEGIGVVCTRVEYQGDRLVASSKNSRLSIVSRQIGYQRHPSENRQSESNKRLGC